MKIYGLSELGYKIFADRYSLKSNDYAEGGTERPMESPKDVWHRVAESVASAEDQQLGWSAKFYQLMQNWKFVPGGRILSAAGQPDLTYYNCFVLPSPQDSKDGILETLQRMVHIMSCGGGVGVNISSLRPKDFEVRGVDGKSSGAVSWGNLYSFATGLISSGGSRRGALGLVMGDWHPDILDFVKAKSEEGGAFTNANISVAISDAFMKALENDSDWQLVFPDTRHPEYDSKWDGDLQAWKDAGYPVLTHKTIKAKELWNAIVESAWGNGEPGIWFIDKTNQMSNSYYLGRLRCTNPCFEEPLPDFGVCCLGSLNLPKFITPDGNTLVWDELNDAIAIAVRFLDDVIDVTPHLDNRSMLLQKAERRIGLGTMGLAETLIRLKLRYGSKDSLVFTNKLYAFITSSAYTASAALAEEKGACSAYDADSFLASGFMKQMPAALRGIVGEKGIRNMTLLTQAPTGSIATMVGTSTGIEPFFDFRYTRKSQLGVDEEYIKVYSEWKENNQNTPLPDYFVTAQDITPDEHIAVQAAIQQWTDASISKTINLPANATKDIVSNVFKTLYEAGCKGGTIYRDRSRMEQVLTRTTETTTARKNPLEASPGIKKLPRMRQGQTISIKTPLGTAHITGNCDDTGSPFEVFVEIGKAGSSTKTMAEAIGRLISLCLRCTEATSIERASLIADQLRGIGGRAEVGFGKERVKSLPDAISKVISEVFLNEADCDNMTDKSIVSNNLSDIHDLDLCPKCGHATLSIRKGCFHCIFCGYSEC